MGNPTSDDEKTTINVKGMSAASWEQAKKAAHRAGDSMGAWLSRACDQLAKIESSDRLILPGNPGTEAGNLRQSPALPAIDLDGIALVIKAMSEANLPVQKRVGAQINAVLYAKLREAQGTLTARDAKPVIGFTVNGNRGTEPAILVHDRQ